MGLFKSGKSKADDLLSILIPSLQWQMQEELKKRLIAQMEDVVNEVATQVIGYGYDEAIKELTVKVRAPKREWVGLTDEDTANICMQSDFNNWHDEQVIDAVEAKLKEKNGAL
jgi:hypothetical protein